MTSGRVATEDCKHRRQTSTLMWPEEANSIRCEDCGVVLREAWSNLTPPARTATDRG